MQKLKSSKEKIARLLEDTEGQTPSKPVEGRGEEEEQQLQQESLLPSFGGSSDGKQVCPERLVVLRMTEEQVDHELRSNNAMPTVSTVCDPFFSPLIFL